VNDNKMMLKITSDTRNRDYWIKGVGNNGITFSAKIFDEGSELGIDNGRISKLDIRVDNKTIVNFDRGWDVGPKSPEQKVIYTAIVSKLNQLSPAHKLESAVHQTMLEKLEAAKEKASMREFEVTITETLQMTITVDAKDQCEAEIIVEERWNDSEFILDAEHFKGAKFEAVAVKREVGARDGDER